MENKETKGIWKFAKWFLGAVGVYFIGAVIKSLSSNIKIWEAIKSIAEFLFRAEVGLLLLILILFKMLYSLNMRHRNFSNKLTTELSNKNVKEILADNKRLFGYSTELRNKLNELIGINQVLRNETEELKHLKISTENLGPKDEVLFILETLANEPNKTEKLSPVKALYIRDFKKNMSDLQIILNELETLDFIYETEGGEFGEICYTILSKGLQYLKENK